MRTTSTIIVAAILVILRTPVPAAAQAWNIDARSVGMGGIGGDQNLFAQTVARERGDRSIVLPLGLIQLLRDRSVFRSDSADFDPARAVEYAANPLHLQFGRSRSTASASFVHDIRNASLQPDFSAYQGFAPASMTARGVIAPKYGPTIWLHEGESGTRHGLFVGAGPHLALRTRLATDPRLALALDTGGESSVGTQRLSMNNTSTAQLASAFTAGYRGRFARSSGAEPGSRPDTAAFVLVNMNYLHGIRYEDVDLALQLQTNVDGRLVSDTDVAPLAFTRHTSSNGRGMSVDIGLGLTVHGFELGFSGNNLGNRIDWRTPTARPYAMRSLFSGDPEIERGTPLLEPTLRVVSPADYRGNIGFRSRMLSVQTEFARVSERTAVSGGLEFQVNRFQFRGATSLANRDWNPTAGLSVAVSHRLWLDLAGFTTTTNVERDRRYALATSLRWAPPSP